MTSLVHDQAVWKVVPVGSDLRDKMLDEAMQECADRIQTSRLQTERQELTPKQAAQIETLLHLDCGMLLSEESIDLTTDVGCFREGDLAFCAEPRRLTLWGQSSSGSADPHSLIFRFVDLPFEIDPECVKTKRNGQVLTIKMMRACPRRS